MVKVICIDDKNRPKEIPESDWVKEGDEYRVTHVSIQVNQKEDGGFVLGCDLYEKPLSKEKHYPYECFRFKRFGCTEENFQELIELIINCCSTSKDAAKQLLEESELQLIEQK